MSGKHCVYSDNHFLECDITLQASNRKGFSMKRVIVVLLVLLLAYAGTASASTLSLGLKAGVNLANTTESPKVTGTDYKIRPGLIIGPMAEIGIPMSGLSVRGELLYTMKGSKFSNHNSLAGINTDGTMKLDEFVFAPFLVYKLPTPVVKPFIEAGPEVGFVLTHKATMGSATSDIPDYAKTNVGLNVGAGVSLPLGTATGSVDLRYNLGLTNMYTGAGDLKEKTNGIQLMLGYAFSIL